MRELPPHPDAGEAMRTLAGAGLRILAVSAGSASSARHLLERAGLADLVERVVSVDDVQRSKPAPEVHGFAAERAGVEADRVALVAAHPWGVHGAKQAGWLAAYVARGVPFPSRVMQRPDVEGEALAEVAGRLAALAP